MTNFDIFIRIIELLSTASILAGFWLVNLKSIRTFPVMGFGQTLATFMCAYAGLWMLAGMHVVIVMMQITGYKKWKKI